MKINAKLVQMLLNTNHFEVVSQLDTYGNGKILEVNAVDKIYLEKSNWQGTSTHNVLIAGNVSKDLKKIIEILDGLGYEKL